MLERAKFGIFPPVRLPSVEGLVFSVAADLSPDVEQEIQQYADEDRISWESQAENSLMFYRESFMTREDHARENIAWGIRNFRPPKHRKKRSLKQWKSFVCRVNEEVSQYRAAGALGNLLLPEELWQFVKLKIEAGAFASPAEVLTAAMPFLRTERGKPRRAGFVDPPLHGT